MTDEARGGALNRGLFGATPRGLPEMEGASQKRACGFGGAWQTERPAGFKVYPKKKPKNMGEVLFWKPQL